MNGSPRHSQYLPMTDVLIVVSGYLFSVTKAAGASVSSRAKELKKAVQDNVSVITNESANHKLIYQIFHEACNP